MNLNILNEFQCTEVIILTGCSNYLIFGSVETYEDVPKPPGFQPCSHVCVFLKNLAPKIKKDGVRDGHFLQVLRNGMVSAQHLFLASITCTPQSPFFHSPPSQATAICVYYTYALKGTWTRCHL